MPMNKFEFGNGLSQTTFGGIGIGMNGGQLIACFVGNFQAGKNANKANGGPDQPLNPQGRDQG